MPQQPHDFEIALTVGVGDAIHRVVVEQMLNRDVATIAGTELLFQWAAQAEGRPLPAAALDYWEATSKKPDVQFSDIQMELENQWGVQVWTHQVDPNAPTPAAPKEVVEERRRQRAGEREIPAEEESDIVDPVRYLRDLMLSYERRREHLAVEIAQKEKLRDRLDNDILRLANMLAASGGTGGNADGRSTEGAPSGTGKPRRERRAFGGTAKVRSRGTGSAGSDKGGSVETAGPANGTAVRRRGRPRKLAVPAVGAGNGADAPGRDASGLE